MVSLSSVDQDARQIFWSGQRFLTLRQTIVSVDPGFLGRAAEIKATYMTRIVVAMVVLDLDKGRRPPPLHHLAQFAGYNGRVASTLISTLVVSAWGPDPQSSPQLRKSF